MPKLPKNLFESLREKMPKFGTTGARRFRGKAFPAWPEVGENERKSLSLVLESGNWGGYPFSRILTRDCSTSNSPLTTELASASAPPTARSTLEIALKAGGLRPGDEVDRPGLHLGGHGSSRTFRPGNPRLCRLRSRQLLHRPEGPRGRNHPANTPL